MRGCSMATAWPSKAAHAAADRACHARDIGAAPQPHTCAAPAAAVGRVAGRGHAG